MAQPSLKLILQYKLSSYEVSAPVSTTFGNLKELAERSTGIPADRLKLLFRGREKPDTELLLTAGVKHGSRIQIAETSDYWASESDAAPQYHQHSTSTSSHPGYPDIPHAANSANDAWASASAQAHANVHGDNRAPQSWEQFSSNGPSHAHTHTHTHHGPGGSAHAHAYASSHAHSPHPHQQHQAQPRPSPRQSHFDATPHTSPRPGASAQTSPRPGASPIPSPRPTEATPSNQAQTPQAANHGPAPEPTSLTPDQLVLRKVAEVGRVVDELSVKAEALLSQGGTDRKGLRGIEEQFTQQLLALDKLEVSGETRAARKAQINRVNAWADRLEALRSI